MDETQTTIIKYSSYTPAQKRATQKYRENNKDKVNEQRKKYYQNRKERDPNFLEYKRNKAKEYYKLKKQAKVKPEPEPIKEPEPEPVKEPEPEPEPVPIVVIPQVKPIGKIKKILKEINLKNLGVWVAARGPGSVAH